MTKNFTSCTKWNPQLIMTFMLDILPSVNNPAKKKKIESSLHNMWKLIEDLLTRVSWPKWGFTPFLQIFQQNAPCLKLIRDMPLFLNSICRKSSFNIKLYFWTIEL